MKKRINKQKSDKLRDTVFQPEFREDLKYWVKTDRKIALRACELIEAIPVNWSRNLSLLDISNRQISNNRQIRSQCRS